MLKSFSVNSDQLRRYAEFYDVALYDYISARVLLRADVLSQGAGLAATSVEKMLKAFLVLKVKNINDFHGHLKRCQWNSLRNLYKELQFLVDVSFMKFLQNSYALRYLDNVKGGSSVVISKYKTLAELDRIMCELLPAVRKEHGESGGVHAFQHLIDEKDYRLFDGNYFLQSGSIDEYFEKSDLVHEVTFLQNYGVVTVKKKLSKGADRKSSFLVQSSAVERPGGGIEGKV